MYITDKKTKQCICSYIRHRYGVNIESNRVYIFFTHYPAFDWEDHYSIRNYPGYNVGLYPENIISKEIDRWGIILSRKDKINKIRENGSK